MQIRMLKTENGSIDGIRVTSYEADVEYDLTATAGERDLAAAFVGAGLAVDLDAKPAKQRAPEPESAATAAPAEPTAKPARAKK